MTSDRCCCGLLHIKHGTITAGTLALLATLINGALFWFGVNRASRHFCFDFCLILIDLVSIISLLYGVLRGRPNFLKPYVYFTLAWCLALIILFIFTLVGLINDSEFSAKIVISIADILNLSRTNEVLQNSSALLAISSLIGLLLSITFNVWFLFVIFKCYQWLTTTGTRKPLRLSNYNHILAPQLSPSLQC